jgi:hypothetical protein
MLKKTKKHLDEVHETYWQHMRFALHMAGTMMMGAVLAVLHALLPAIFQCSASERIFKLADEMRARKDKQHCK